MDGHDGQRAPFDHHHHQLRLKPLTACLFPRKTAFSEGTELNGSFEPNLLLHQVLLLVAGIH